MKKEKKALVLGIAIGGLMFGSIGVFAATYFSADQIKFTPTDESWNVDNAQDAMNDLYTNNSLGKNLIADAITNKGVATSGTSSFNDLATNIGKIEVAPTYLTYTQTYSLDTNANTMSGSFSFTATNMTKVLGITSTTLATDSDDFVGDRVGITRVIINGNTVTFNYLRPANAYKIRLLVTAVGY